MKYTLVHIFPDGAERPVSMPFPTIQHAANLAARSLHDTGRASKVDAKTFAAYLANLIGGRTLTHGPSGYAARVEWAAGVAVSDLGKPMRITKTQERNFDGAWAEVWEARTGGPASVRTRYQRWIADGEHWVADHPVMLEDGTVNIGGGMQRHAAGDVYASTVRGLPGRTFHILVPERQLPQGAPTAQLLMPGQ